MNVEYTANNRMMVYSRPPGYSDVRFALDKELQRKLKYMDLNGAKIWPYSIQNSIVKELIICPRIYCLLPLENPKLEQFCLLKESNGSVLVIDFGISSVEPDGELLTYSIDVMLEKVGEEDLNLYLSHIENHCVWIDNIERRQKIQRAMKRRLVNSIIKMQERYG